MKKRSKLIKVILTFALIIGAFSFNSSFAAAQDVEINETNFPDAYFRRMLKEGYDADQNGKLSESEIKAIKSLRIFLGGERLNLKGLEFFTVIKNL